MIRSIDIHDDRRRRRVGRSRVEFAPGLNMLVGANGSGKSSVLGAVLESISAVPTLAGVPPGRVDADTAPLHYHDFGRPEAQTSASPPCPTSPAS